MNRDELKTYAEIKNKALTTSEVIKDSFVNVIKELNKEDYVIIENQRQKITMVVQDINKFTIDKKVEVRSFDGKVKNPEENKLLLKTFIKENLFYLMKFESKNITFPEIEIAIENSQYFKDEFILRITNQLMDGFKFIINSPIRFNFNLFLNINAIVAKEQALEWGVLRKGKVTISGTNFVPQIPKKKDIEKLFDQFSNAKDKYKSVSLLLPQLIKKQPFFDGNKRTAFLAVNMLMIENSMGLLSVSDNNFFEFNRLLNNYYNDESKLEELSTFILKKCMFNTMDKKLVR